MKVSRSASVALALLSAAALPIPALAGGNSGCHFHGSTPANEKVVLECASKRVDTLAANGKIDGAWKGKTHEKIEMIEVKRGKEWKVTYADPAAKDAAKSKLYLFFSHSGNFLAANHTGE
jgi:Family of unknown function (DUF6488)